MSHTAAAEDEIPASAAAAASRTGDGPFARLIEHLRTPLHRNAYALVASGGLTSVLGLLYWLLAARRYSKVDVGLGGAAVSSMMLLANAAGLGLQNGFVRLIPSAGNRTRRFVAGSMALAAGVAAVLAVIFIVGLQWWAPRLVPIFHASFLAGAAFVVATVFWVLFVLQDSALIGLRRATLIPVENMGFSMVKIGVVVGFATAFPRWGIFASWGLSAAAAVVVMCVVVLPPLLHRAASGARTHQLPSNRGLTSYLAAEHTSMLLWLGTVELIPLVVLHRLGAEANAYYYLAAQLATALMLLPTAIGVSLTAEAANDPAMLQSYVRRGARNIVVILVPVVLAVVLFASIGLQAFGKSYGAAATSLLRLMALGALPYAATSLMMSVARVQRRMRVITTTYFCLATLTFGLTLVLLGPLGLTGAGIASLVAQVVVAAGALATQLHRIGVRCFDRILARLAAGPQQFVRRRAAARVVQRVLPEITGLGTVHSVDVLSTRNDVIVARIRTSEHGTQILKVSESPGAAASVRRAAAAMRRIRVEVPALAPLIPAVTHSQTIGTRICSIEAFRSGDTGLERLAAHSLSLRSLESGLAAVGTLHRATAAATVVDGRWLALHVGDPIGRVRHALTSERAFAQLDQIKARLDAELSGRQITTATIHGDVAPGNLLFDLETRDLTALLDWESSTTGALPEVDLFQLLFALHADTGTAELDEIVPRLARGDWTIRDAALIGEAEVSRPNLDQLGPWAITTLTWLAHVDANLGKARWYRESTRWVERNLEGVIAQLSRPAGPAAAPRLIRPSAVSAPVSTVEDRPAAVAVRPIQPPMLRHERGVVTVEAPRPVAIVEPLPLAGRLLARPVVILPVASALWVAGVRGLDLTRMTSLGLLSVIRPVGYAALALLLASIVVNLVPTRPNGRNLAALLAGFIAFIHGTPAAIYAALRYSWAWKHVGIVDFILRTKGVDPRVGQLAVYHQWPGFFAAAATLTRAVGAPNALAIASWGPVAFNLMNLVLLVFVLGSLSEDRRTVWLGTTLFFVANWVGQDYFSPQALTYVLYLGVIGLVLQRFRRDPVDVPGRSWNGAATAVVIGVAIVAVATSHQLTPVILTASLLALALLRRTRTWWFGLFSLVVNVVWGATIARRFVSSQLRGVLDRFGAVAGNTGSTISDTSVQSSGQALVSVMGRLGLLLVGVLAVAGFVRRWRAGRREWIAATLTMVPASVLVVNDYGGEVVFRVVLFAMPFVVLLAAHALIPQADRRWKLTRGLSVFAVTGLLLTGFLFGYYGKEHQYSFTSAEVGATTYVEAHSSGRTLLVTVNANYPNLISEYERFTTVAIVDEPAVSRARVLAQPASVLAGWLANTAYTSTYLLVTRSQLIAAEDIGELSTSVAERLASQLQASPLFVAVYSTPDATVYRLAASSPSPQEPA